MLFLAYFILVFHGVQFIVALLNVIFIQKLPKKSENPGELVSVLIPARNEEKNIGTLLNDLLKQSVQNIEIIVFNDQSVDATERIVEKYAQKEKRIKLVNSGGLPSGWLGKNHACHSLSKMAKGDYFLFLDADVRIYKDIILQTLSYAKKHKLGLLSVFPRQIMKTLGEKLTVPVMNYILLTLLPLFLVRKLEHPSLSAANGQFMLFEAESYKKLLPHEKMKNTPVEDIAISRFYKQNNMKIACMSGIKDIACRMYHGCNDALYGFSRNVRAFFGNSFIAALLFWLITTFGFIPVWLFLPFELFTVYLIGFVLIRILVSYTSRQNIFENIILSIPQQFALGIILFRTIINRRKNKLIWKGRNIIR